MSKVNTLGQQILKSKYLAADEKTPEDLFFRVARVGSIPDVIDRVLAEGAYSNQTVAFPYFDKYIDLAKRVHSRRNATPFTTNMSADDFATIWSEETVKYYKAMCDLDFMPATPTLMNAGIGGMLSSCFAIKVPDSMEGIFETIKQVAIISQKGGGCGVELSNLRPEGSPVGPRGGVSSGPISFMKVFNEAGNQVKQGGQRRAALLAGLQIDHPDIQKFIHCKEKEGELSNFNISVFVTDEFMDAINRNKEIVLKHSKSKDERKIKARDLWNELITAAHANGEPGIIFKDTINKCDPFKGKLGSMLVNPCAELVLHEYSSCNLGSINLSNCYSSTTQIDVPKLENLVRLGIRFLDNVIDLNAYPIQEIENMTLKVRPIGLGTMGLHDLMLKNEIKYGSTQSLELIDKVYSIIKKTAEQESNNLYQLRGTSKEIEEQGIKRRNSSLLTAPPTGTISMICNQVSSGIEPVFQWEYTRKDTFGIHKMKHFMLDKFETEENLPEYAKTALEISPKYHVKVQAQLQRWIDSSISKTVNLPNEATVEDVERIYLLAHKLGCKSITVYRSGSRKDEVLIKKDSKEVLIEEKTSAEDEETTVNNIEAEVDNIDNLLDKPTSRPRPSVLFGATFKINTPGGKAYITINEDNRGIREVFIHISKAGSEIATHVEAEGRLISHSLKHGIPADTIISHLAGHKSNPIFDSGRSVKSVPDAVALVMQEYKAKFEGFSEFIETEQRIVTAPTKPIGEISGELCPECGEVLYMASGCTECASCGFSQCG